MEQSKAELKARLEKALRRPIPQTAWDRFDRDGWIEDYFTGELEHEWGERENFQSLKGRFADELDYLKSYDIEKARTLADSERSRSLDISVTEAEPSSGSYVATRARAISEVWAALADERPDVFEFRETVLGGRLLSPEEASAIIDASGGTLDELRELELRKLGSILVNDYYGWDKEGAIWYVLTGDAPQLQPVRIRARGKLPVEYYVPFQYDVTFSVLPWVPAKEVERAYRSAQKRLLEETPRETDTRILEVVQFWWEQFRAQGSMPSWPAWFKLWNQTHPNKKFQNWRNFREYFFRGTKKAQPHYKRFPQPKPPAEEQQEMYAPEEYIIKAVQAKRNLGDRYTELTFE
jgi:hypothetical protein